MENLEVKMGANRDLTDGWEPQRQSESLDDFLQRLRKDHIKEAW